MVVSILISALLAQSGCTKDTDCKGERVCEEGRCVNPTPTAPPPPAPTPPPMTSSAPANEYPKVVHRDGLVCVQTLKDNGQLEEACRPETARTPLNSGATSTPSEPPEYELPATPTRARRRARFQQDEPAPPPRSRFVADFGALGGVAIGFVGSATLALPQFNAHVELGGRLTPNVGLGAVIDEKLAFNGFGAISITSLCLGLRLGDASHTTLAAGFGGLYGVTGASTVGGIVGTVLVHSTFIVSGGFGIHFQGGLSFDASGAFLSFGLGLGGSVI